MSEIKTFSFRKGYRQLTLEQTPLFRDNIMKALSLSRESFYRRLRGEVEPKVTEAAKIIKIFKEYNITENIWGD